MTSDTTQRLTKRLMPRDAFTWSQDRSTAGKIDCVDVQSRTEAGVTHQLSHTHHNDSYWCSCKGFSHHGFCAHLDSYRYWVEVKAARSLIADTNDAELANLDRQLAGRTDPNWTERALIEAVGDAVLARLAQGEMAA